MPLRTDDEIRRALSYDRVAVVGCSATAGKEAHGIPKYLLDHGYDVIPVNPYADEVFGREAYDGLLDVPGEVEVVDVFRPSDEVAGIVDDAIERGDVKVVWTQLGIRDAEATERAEEAGIDVVENECMKVEHQRLL